MKKGSVVACSACVVICMLLVAVLACVAPTVTGWYAEVSDLGQAGRVSILAGFYVSSLPAVVALACLLALLRNIASGKIFQTVNSALISVVSWCCIAVAAATGVAGVWFQPFFFSTAAMIFIFLIVRVVRGCFDAAISLREENDLTI